MAKEFAFGKNFSEVFVESLNGTVDDGPSTTSLMRQPMLKSIHDILIVVLLICVMFAMGCSITIEQVSYSSLSKLLLLYPS